MIINFVFPQAVRNVSIKRKGKIIPFETGRKRKKQESYNKYLLVVLGSQLKVLVYLKRNRKEEKIDAFVRTHFSQNHDGTKFSSWVLRDKVAVTQSIMIYLGFPCEVLESC